LAAALDNAAFQENLVAVSINLSGPYLVATPAASSSGKVRMYRGLPWEAVSAVISQAVNDGIGRR